MATIHISEAEAIREVAALLQQVRAGADVIIDGDASSILMTASQPDAIAEPEPGYNAWFCQQVQEALDADPQTFVDGDVVEAMFVEKRRNLTLQLQGK